MVIKRKTVSKIAGAAAKVPRGVKDRAVEEEEVENNDAQIVAVEEKKEASEQEVVATRTKELKSLKLDDLKSLLTSLGLETGKKEDMIKTVLKHEAKARKAAQEQKAKIRSVVIKKKQELEGLSATEIGKLCDANGIKGLRSKEERVQRLLVHWQEADGVDKALAEIAQCERKAQLDAMDVSKLQKLCNKAGVDPLVQEIMVDRLSKRESDSGCYARPALIQEVEPAKEQTGDMIDALLASEAQRKREREEREQREEAALQKRKEFKSLSIDELKKRLSKKGLEASGKKDDMVDALFISAMQEEVINARRAELKGKPQQELKDLLSRYGLEAGSKDQMLKTVLDHEAKIRQDLKAFDARVGEIAEQKKQELANKANAALKELCVAKGVAVGGGKEEKVDRLIEEILKEGSLDKVVSQTIRNQRRSALLAMDKAAVRQLCEKTGVDPFVKDIMVERLMAFEAEGGADAIALEDERPAKRARKSK